MKLIKTILLAFTFLLFTALSVAFAQEVQDDTSNQTKLDDKTEPLDQIQSNYKKAEPKIKVDEDSMDQELETLKKEFRKDLEHSLDGLVLTDLDKKDLSERVDNLLNSYKKKESYQKLAGSDEYAASQLNAFGKNEVVNDWVDNQVSYTKIFDEYPQDVYKDKQVLKQNLRDIKALSDQKSGLTENWDLDKSLLNDYHKYLNGQTSLETFEKKVKSSPDYKSNTPRKKQYKRLLKKVNQIEKEEGQVNEEIKDNKYVAYLQREHGEDIVKEELDGEINYNQLDKLAKEEEIRNVLDNDFLSDHINEHKPKFGNVGAGVVKKEVLQALDSSGGKWVDKAEAVKDKGSEKVDKKEVEELVLKDTDENKFMPGNSFFEGIIGLSTGDFSVFSISPNYGYEFENGLSAGIGLTLHHTQDKEAYVRSALDYKVLGKYEMFKDIFFIKAEYIAMIPGISYLDAKEGAVAFKNTVLIGGGVSVKIKGKKILSLGMMYNLNQNMGVPTYDSPILARFGVKLF